MDQPLYKIGEGNKYFASLDLKSGYWQIVIEECSRYKITFTWRDQCFQSTRLLLRLTSAGHIFSRCVTGAPATVSSHDNISSYIDDSLVHASIFKGCLTNMRQLFSALKMYGLKLNPEKCIFLAPKAKFLGRIFNSKGFQADPEFVCIILDIKSQN